MITLPHGARIWLAYGVNDLRRGFDGLAVLVQSQLSADPYGGHLFLFRGRRGNRLKILSWSGDGLNLFAKRLDGGRLCMAAGGDRHGGDDGCGAVDFKAESQGVAAHQLVERRPAYDGNLIK